MNGAPAPTLTAAGYQAALIQIQTWLDGIEKYPDAWGFKKPWQTALTLEMIVLNLVETRQVMVRPTYLAVDPDETRTAWGRFINLWIGEEVNVPLTCVVRDERRLAELPALLGDAAAWVALELPPEDARRSAGAHDIAWRHLLGRCRACGAETFHRIGHGPPVQLYRRRPDEAWAPSALACPPAPTGARA